MGVGAWGAAEEVAQLRAKMEEKEKEAAELRARVEVVSGYKPLTLAALAVGSPS